MALSKKITRSLILAAFGVALGRRALLSLRMRERA